MSMRNLFMVSALMLTGCLLPLELAQDGGAAPVDGGETGFDAGCDPGSGIDWSETECILPELAPRAAGPISLLFPGCRYNPLVLEVKMREAIPILAVTDSVGTRISSEEWPPGLYQVTFGTAVDRKTTTLEVYAHQQLDAGIVRTYVDPIDTCLSVAITEQSRLVCQRAGQVVVYENDGGVHTTFAGDDVAVAGDELWSRGGGGIERHVDGPAGVLLEGSLVDARVSAGGPFGETSPGRTMRGSLNEVIEFSWNGTVMTSRSWPIGLGRRFVFLSGETVWTDQLCRCENGVCSGDDLCPFRGAGLLGVAENSVWGVEAPASIGLQYMLDLPRSLPLTHDLPRIRQVPVLTTGFPVRGPGFDLPVFQVAAPSTTGAVLVRQGAWRTHFVVMSEKVLANTPRAVITHVGAFTVRITPHQ